MYGKIFPHAVNQRWNHLMIPVVQWHHLLCRENLWEEDDQLDRPVDESVSLTIPLHLGQHFSPSFPWIRWVVTFASSKNRGFELGIQIEIKTHFWLFAKMLIQGWICVHITAEVYLTFPFVFCSRPDRRSCYQARHTRWNISFSDEETSLQASKLR